MFSYFHEILLKSRIRHLNPLQCEKTGSNWPKTFGTRITMHIRKPKPVLDAQKDRKNVFVQFDQIWPRLPL